MGKVTTLRRQADFARLFAQGDRYHHELLTSVVYRRPDDEAPRVAFVVSRKIGKAVVRNRVKRRLREAWRRELPNTRAGVDVAFVAQPPAAETTYHNLAAVMHRHLSQAGLVG